MKHTITIFGGEQPALDPRMLPETKAQTSINARVGYGRLEPLKGNSPEGRSVAAGTKTIHLYEREANAGQGFWLEWNADIDVLPSPVIDDVWARVYWTGDGAPKMSLSSIITQAPPYPANQYLLGIPQPASSTMAAVSPGADEDELQITVVYAITYVSAYGEEGPPSLATDSVTRPDGHGVTLTSIPTAPAGNHNIATKRIYRSDGGDYLLVGEIPVATTSFADAAPADSLSMAMESLDWDGPDANLTGIVLLPNGVMAGFFDNVLCFTPPYVPHAWPTRYRLTTKTDIVALGVTASGLVVLTEDSPYLCVGSDPEAMQLANLDIPQGCIAKRSVVDMGNYVLYASPDGLVAAGGSEARVVTKQVFTKAQWNALNPSTFRACRYDGAYLCFHDSGGFMLNPETGDLVQLADLVDCTYYDSVLDTLYLCQNGVINEFDSSATSRLATYRSSKVVVPNQIPFACAKIDADDYPVTLKVFGDGELLRTESVASAKAIRLPTNSRYRLAEFEITTSHAVHSVQLAHSMSELA